MKCFLVLLSLVAFTYAVPITFGAGKTVTIDEDGTITILGEAGKKIVINKAIGNPGPKDIEISVGGPLGPTKKIQINGETNIKTVDLLEPNFDEYNFLNDEDRNKRSSFKATKESSKGSKYSKDSKESKPKESQSQADLLSNLFQEYQGVVDDKTYNQLVTKLNSLVQSGEMNPAVFNILRSLDQYSLAVKYQQSPLLFRGYPYGYPWEYPTANQQQFYSYNVVPEEGFGGVMNYGDMSSLPRAQHALSYPLTPEQLQQWYEQQQLQEQSTVDPWTTYRQSLLARKQMVNPWIGFKRPATTATTQNVDTGVRF